MQKAYSQRIHRDKAYRSHIARQMAEYRCDASSGCPHHSEEYIFHISPQETPQVTLSAYEKLLSPALSKFKRYSAWSISALELLASDYLSLVKFCRACYDAAIAGVEHNQPITLCEPCLNKRETYIIIVNSHQSTFLEPWEEPVRERLQGNYVTWAHIFFAILEYDSYIDTVKVQQVGGGAIEIAGLVFAGLAVPGTIFGLARCIYSKRQWRLAMDAQEPGRALRVLDQLARAISNGRITVDRQDVEAQPIDQQDGEGQLVGLQNIGNQTVNQQNVENQTVNQQNVENQAINQQGTERQSTESFYTTRTSFEG